MSREEHKIYILGPIMGGVLGALLYARFMAQTEAPMTYRPQIEGSGSNGRITVRDVLRAVQKG